MQGGKTCEIMPFVGISAAGFRRIIIGLAADALAVSSASRWRHAVHTAKMPSCQGFKGGDFFVSADKRKNTTRPLTTWQGVAGVKAQDKPYQYSNVA